MTWLHPIIDWVFAQVALSLAGNPVAVLVLNVVHGIIDKFLFGAAAALEAQGLSATSPLTAIIDAAFTYFEQQLQGHPILIKLLQEANAYIDQWVSGAGVKAIAAQGLKA